MLRFSVALAVVLSFSFVACGGPEFSDALFSSDAVDAGGDVAGDTQKPRDAASSADGSKGEDAAGDVAGELEAAVDAGVACTPFPPGTQWPSSAPCGQSAFNVPANYADLTEDDAGAGQCAGRATPAACRCQETFTCACLEAHAACGARSFVACHQGIGETPTPTCR